MCTFETLQNQVHDMVTPTCQAISSQPATDLGEHHLDVDQLSQRRCCASMNKQLCEKNHIIILICRLQLQHVCPVYVMMHAKCTSFACTCRQCIQTSAASVRCPTFPVRICICTHLHKVHRCHECCCWQAVQPSSINTCLASA